MPDYKEIAEVILEKLRIVSTISTTDLIDELKIHFNLSTSDLLCKTKCDRQFKFNNRVIYARTYLVRKGIVKVDEKKTLRLKRIT